MKAFKLVSLFLLSALICPQVIFAAVPTDFASVPAVPTTEKFNPAGEDAPPAQEEFLGFDEFDDNPLEPSDSAKKETISKTSTAVPTETKKETEDSPIVPVQGFTSTDYKIESVSVKFTVDQKGNRIGSIVFAGIKTVTKGKGSFSIPVITISADGTHITTPDSVAVLGKGLKIDGELISVINVDYENSTSLKIVKLFFKGAGDNNDLNKLKTFREVDLYNPEKTYNDIVRIVKNLKKGDKIEIKYIDKTKKIKTVTGTFRLSNLVDFGKDGSNFQIELEDMVGFLITSSGFTDNTFSKILDVKKK